MNRYDRYSFLIVLVLFVVGSGQSTVQAQSAEQVFDRLKAKYEAIETLRAEFSQTMTSTYTDDRATSTGVLYLSGDKYRIETDGQTFVTDGATTWIFTAADNQVLVNDYVEDETTFNINDFFFNYKDRYDVSDVQTSQIGGEKHHVLTLRPKEKDAFFTEVTLSMRDADDVVTRLQVVDVNGTTMLFDLDEIVLDPTLEADTFRFTAPDTAEVVDLRM